MKKILKLLTVTTGFVLISSNSWAVIACSMGGTTEPTISGRDYAVSLMRYQNLPANSTDFIQYYEKQLKTPASAASNQEFNQLYDANPNAGAFSSFDELNSELANTQMGEKNCQVNWTTVFNDVNLTGSDLVDAQQGILRFNNILAKLYGKTNTLRLVQSNEVNTTSGNIVAYTERTSNTEMQRMVFGPSFVDTSLINQQYQQGFWSSNNIDSVSIHEYGHALSNFCGVDPSNRDTFNNNWNWPSSYRLNFETYSNTHNSLNINLIKKLGNAPEVVDDRAQLLMNFLRIEGREFVNDHGLSTYYDPWNPEEYSALFPYILLESNYGRTYLTTGATKDEFFAESFAAWLLTPQNERGWNWQLFNEFFVHVLPYYVDMI